VPTLDQCHSQVVRALEKEGWAVEEKPFTLEIVKHHILHIYAGNAHKARLYPVLDDEHQTYAVIVIEDERNEGAVWVTLMARVIGAMVIIEEDASLNKPLVDALMVNGGVPCEKIILAYKGEKLPTEE